MVPLMPRNGRRWDRHDFGSLIDAAGGLLCVAGWLWFGWGSWVLALSVLSFLSAWAQPARRLEPWVRLLVVRFMMARAGR